MLTRFSGLGRTEYSSSWINIKHKLFLFNQTCWDICGHKKDTSSHLGLKNLFEPVDNMDGKQKRPHLSSATRLACSIVLHTRSLLMVTGVSRRGWSGFKREWSDFQGKVKDKAVLLLYADGPWYCLKGEFDQVFKESVVGNQKAI